LHLVGDLFELYDEARTCKTFNLMLFFSFTNKLSQDQASMNTCLHMLLFFCGNIISLQISAVYFGKKENSKFWKNKSIMKSRREKV
jgi:hypothetical protein